MDEAILFPGDRRVMCVDRVETNVTPFIGVIREEYFARLGVGLLYDHDRIQFYGLVVQRSLMTSWRAFVLLNNLQYIHKDGREVTACYFATRRELPPAESALVQTIAPQFGGTEELESIRERIRTCVPSAPVLDNILRGLREKNISLDPTELQEEIRHQRIWQSPEVQRALKSSVREFIH
jgi:hypothetical protein